MRPAFQGAWVGGGPRPRAPGRVGVHGARVPGRLGGHSPLCSRRYSAFSRIHSSAFTRASASFRMYWGRAQHHSQRAHAELSSANVLPFIHTGQEAGLRPKTERVWRPG